MIIKMKTPLYIPLFIFTLFISLNFVEFYLVKDKTLVSTKISTDSISTKLENGCNMQGYEISNYFISPCIFNESNYSFGGYNANGFSIPVSYYYNQKDNDNWYARIFIALIKICIFFMYIASFLFSIQPKNAINMIGLMLLYFLALICITLIFSLMNLININMELDHTLCSVAKSNISCSVLDLSTQNKWFMQPCLLDIEQSGIVDCYYNDDNHFPLTANYFDKNKSINNYNIFIFTYLLIINFTPTAIMLWYVKYKEPKETEMTEYGIIEDVD